MKFKKLHKTGLLWLWLAVVVILLDQVTKSWATQHLVFFEPLKVLPFFNLTLAYNTGAAFSFLHAASGWQNVFLGSLAGIVSGVVLVWLANISCRDRLTSIGLCLILGGALGNAWDRFMYRYVIDFLDFHIGDWHFAIFNIADSAICIGAGLLLLHWLLPTFKKK